MDEVPYGMAWPPMTVAEQANAAAKYVAAKYGPVAHAAEWSAISKQAKQAVEQQQKLAAAFVARDHASAKLAQASARVANVKIDVATKVEAVKAELKQSLVQTLEQEVIGQPATAKSVAVVRAAVAKALGVPEYVVEAKLSPSGKEIDVEIWDSFVIDVEIWDSFVGSKLIKALPAHYDPVANFELPKPMVYEATVTKQKLVGNNTGAAWKYVVEGKTPDGKLVEASGDAKAVTMQSDASGGWTVTVAGHVVAENTAVTFHSPPQHPLTVPVTGKPSNYLPPMPPPMFSWEVEQPAPWAFVPFKPSLAGVGLEDARVERVASWLLAGDNVIWLYTAGLSLLHADVIKPLLSRLGDAATQLKKLHTGVALKHSEVELLGHSWVRFAKPETPKVFGLEADRVVGIELADAHVAHYLRVKAHGRLLARDPADRLAFIKRGEMVE